MAQRPATPETRLARVLDALKIVNALHPLGDAVYAVRDRAASDPSFTGDSTWDHPDVKRYSDAVGVLDDEMKRGP